MKIFKVVCYYMICFLFSCTVYSSEWQWSNPHPTGNGLTDIWGTSADNIYIVGRRVLNFDGQNWVNSTAGINKNFSHIHGSSSNVVYAVTSGNSGSNCYRYDGTNWSLIPNDDADRYTFSELFCASENNLIGVGNYHVNGDNGAVFYFDGQSWEIVYFKDELVMRRAWVSPDNKIFVGGYNREENREGFVHIFDGNEWIESLEQLDDEVEKIWGTSSDNVFAVTGTNGVYHFDGNEWDFIS